MRMSAFSIVAAIVTAGGICTRGAAAPFVNLGFEDSAYVGDINSPSPVPVGDLFPGWSVEIGGIPATSGYYNTTLLAGADVAIFHYAAPDAHVLQGQRTAYLQAWFATNVTLGQVGDIPVGTKSIRFRARNAQYPITPTSIGRFDITIDGQPLTVQTLSQGGGDYALGADVAAFAGQHVGLQIISSQNDPLYPVTSALVDAIEFSPVPIPEPTATVLGPLAIGLCLKRTGVRGLDYSRIGLRGRG